LEDLIDKKAEELRSNIKADKKVGLSIQKNKTIVNDKESNRNSDNELPDQMETEEDNSLDSTPRKRNESRDNHLRQDETSIKEST
jgi:hypothetical protein